MQCKRCGRQLKTKKSLVDGYGRACLAKWRRERQLEDDAHPDQMMINDYLPKGEGDSEAEDH